MGLIVGSMAFFYLFLPQDNPYNLTDKLATDYQAFSFEHMMANKKSSLAGEESQKIWQRYQQIYSHVENIRTALKRVIKKERDWLTAITFLEASPLKPGPNFDFHMLTGIWRSEGKKEISLNWLGSQSAGAKKEVELYLAQRTQTLDVGAPKQDLVLISHNKDFNSFLLTSGQSSQTEEKTQRAVGFALSKKILFWINKPLISEEKVHYHLILYSWEELSFIKEELSFTWDQNTRLIDGTPKWQLTNFKRL